MTDYDEARKFYDAQQRRFTRCHADDDGYCTWTGCPQLQDGEPGKSGRHCPLDTVPDGEGKEG